jgi:hypothetical protein
VYDDGIEWIDSGARILLVQDTPHSMKTTKILTALLAVSVLSLIGLGIWIARLNEQHRHALADQKLTMEQTHQAAIDSLTTRNEQVLAARQAEQERVIKALNEDFEKRIDSLRKDQQNKMASAFREFESIFDGNKKTIDYINALESRVKAGQGVSKAEVEKLAVIATGISFLQKEYQKPFQEFHELESFLSKQAAMSQTKPESNFGFFKRMFNKEFREAEKEYYRNEGARMAFTEAKGKFSTVYNAAQKQMASVGLNGDQYVKKLYALIDDKNKANTEDLSDFFDQARKALKTHQDVLDFQPEKLPDLPVKPQP